MRHEVSAKEFAYQLLNILPFFSLINILVYVVIAIGLVTCIKRCLLQKKQFFLPFLALVIFTADIVTDIKDIAGSYEMREEILDMSEGRDPIGTYDITVDKENGKIYVNGFFAWGISDAIEKAIKDNPDVSLIVFDSPGGRGYEGFRAGKILQRYSLNSHVEFSCNSACVDAFLGGKIRTASYDAKLGLHSADYGDGISKKNYTMFVPVFDFFMLVNTKKNVPFEFKKKANQIPPSEIWYPTHDELIEANIITDS